MPGSAPQSFTYIHEKSKSAKAPITRDLLKKLVDNLNHTLVRVNDTDGVAENLSVAGGLVGHGHYGGNDGMVLCRPIDTRIHRIVQPNEVADAKDIRDAAVICRQLALSTTGAWEDILVLPSSSSGLIGVTPTIYGVRLSHGVERLGMKILFHIIPTAKSGGEKVANIRLGVRSSGSGNYSYGREIPLYTNYDAYADADSMNLDWGAPQIVTIGGVQTDRTENWNNLKEQMPDVSAITASGGSKVADINLQIQRLRGDDAPRLRDAILFIWGYTLFEVAEYFQR
ncbi:MAG: hypothetical protein Kow0090_08850 [Myxococcota bacterium]